MSYIRNNIIVYLPKLFVQHTLLRNYHNTTVGLLNTQIIPEKYGNPISLFLSLKCPAVVQFVSKSIMNKNVVEVV